MELKRARRWAAQLIGNGPPVVSVVKLAGTIAPRARLSSGGLSLEGLTGTLTRAFEGAGVKAVALAINSPGGSPAQSTLIHDRIRALAAEKKLPVFAFAEDVAASGGYMLACAADEIFATESSILGSIGVIAATFGFEKLIEKAGIERRLFTAGGRKSLLDPFLPVDAEDVARLKAVQNDIHDSFKALVRARRGSRLAAPEDELFSGEFWTGKRAIQLGLADGIGDLRSEMRRRYGEDVVFRVLSPERRRFGFLPSGVTAERGPALLRLGPGGIFEDVLAHLEARAIWSRFGL
jgi:signal peptide peptidase SppA